jgi:ATP-dependent helicase/nuclease subunit A
VNDVDGALLPDAEARRAAIETLDRPLLVEAGAGTGKTTLVVERILHALAIGAARMPGVVAITFTEKAAAELRLRLRLQLEARLDDERLAGPPRARLGRALVELDRASVSTIHAFAAGLLRARPVQAGIDSRFRTLDELESAHLFGAFWKSWMDAHVDDEATAAQLGAALLAGVRLEPDLQRLSRELDAQRDLIAGLEVRVPGDLASRLQAFVAGVEAARAHADSHCRDAADRGVANLRATAARLAPFARLPTESRLGLFLESLQIDARAGRADGWDPGAAATNKALRRALRDELAALRQAISDRLLHGVFAWLRRFAADYGREKQRRGVLDFQDLLVYARRLLQDDVAVRRELGDRIDLLCVDEFQDTDPLQAEIVWLLAESGPPAPRWHDAVVGPKLFLVGDPKQSIYRFRRADPEVYERCAERVLASGGLRLDIVRNFRSRPAVIDWVNGVFATLFAPGDGPRHVPLAAGPDALATPAVWRLQPAYGDGGAEAERRAEAAAIVAWVARALRDRWPVRDGDGVRPLAARDIALLFARTSGVEIYEAALRAAGLPFQQEGGRQFFERQEVRDVLQALAAIDDPHDEVAVIATLRSPLFGVTDPELWLHRAHHGGFVYLQPPVESPLAARLDLLAALHAERHADGVAGTITRLLDRTGARAFHAAQPHGAQALANLEMLQRHARQFEAAHGAGLREFVRALADIDRDAPRVAEWAPQDEEENRIRVLTVHMAKGLEFACVVLANVGARGSSRPPAFVVDRLAAKLEVKFAPTDAEQPLQTAGFEALQARERQRDDAEERRLLYVAATRARDYLVVPEPGPGGGGGFAKLLRAAPAALGDGGPLGPFVDAGSAVPAARACVVAAADLPAPVPQRPPGVDRRDLEAASARRAAWAAHHAARLRAGGAPADVAAAPVAPAAASPPWPWRALVARGLDAMASGEPAPAAARRLAALHGAARHAPALEALCLAAAVVERRQDWVRTRRGVQMLAATGGNWFEAWLDLVGERPDGLWVAMWALEPPPPSPHLGEPIAALATLARASGRPVTGGGTACLRTGTFVPFAHLAARLAAIDG